MKSDLVKKILKYLLVAALSAIMTFAITISNYSGRDFMLRQLIKTYYVEDVDDSVLDEGAKAGIVAALGDEHSVYIDSDYGFDHFEDSISGEYSGIGAVIANENKKAVIQEVYEGSPADKAGLLPGDIITAVDGVPSKGSTLNDVSKRLLGKDGTQVKILITRNETDTEYTVTRAPISVHTVSTEELEGGIGYIKISSFDIDTDKELTDALKKLKNSQKLIIDLRDNPGGYMDVALNMVDMFIDDGVIVTAKYKKDEKVYSASKETISDLSKDFLMKTPIIVLVNNDSASASEIFSAAMQDHKRATILGTNTFGKGSIQSTFSLGNNTGVKLTIGHFYSPNGTKIDKKGVKPDIEINLDEEYKDNPISKIPRENDTQLNTAIAELNK